MNVEKTHYHRSLGQNEQTAIPEQPRKRLSRGKRIGAIATAVVAVGGITAAAALSIGGGNSNKEKPAATKPLGKKPAMKTSVSPAVAPASTNKNVAPSTTATPATTAPAHEGPDLNLNANLCDSSKLQSDMEQIFGSSSASCKSGGNFKEGLVGFEWTLPQPSGVSYSITTNINDTRHQDYSGPTEAPIDGPKSFFGKGKYTQVTSINGYECYDDAPPSMNMACFVEKGVVLDVNNSTINMAAGGELVSVTDQQFEAVGKAMVQAMQG